MFSIKIEGVRVSLNFFGIKLKFCYTKQINYPVNTNLINNLEQNVPESTVLMLEANDFHGEVMPGFISYLLDLGYNIDLLATEKHKEDCSLCRLKTDKVRTYYANVSTIEKILQNKEILTKYKGVFINSQYLFRKDRAFKLPVFIFDYFKNVQIPPEIFSIYVCHTMEKFEKEFFQSNNCIVLAQTKIPDLPVVNPCYFGDIKVTGKNEKTIFLISGDNLKNYTSITNSVKKLLRNGISNFKIYITGRNRHAEIANDLEDYIEFLGYLDFEKLYNLVAESDFILPCLEPEIEKHQWYIDYGTSGAFQLSYGFVKPMLIAEKFAPKALVNNESAIVYKNNEDFTEAMEKAIFMNQDEYKTIQKNLQEISKQIYQRSLKNLQEMIQKK